MISKLAIKYVKYRFYSFQWSGATYITYDKKTDKLVDPHPYLLFLMQSGFVAGFSFIFIQSFQIYLKLSKDIEEEAGGPIDEELQREQNNSFATMVLGWGELAVVGTMVSLNLVANRERHKIMYIYNAMFAYSESIWNFLQANNIELDRAHKKASLKFDGIMWVTTVLTMTLGLLVSIACLHPLEPTHVIIKEWLEVDFSWNPKFLPFFLMFMSVIQGCVNTSIIFGMLAELYVFLASNVLTDLTAERVVRRHGSRCTLQTHFFGNLEDQEICCWYRTQRYLNWRVNEIMGSIFITMHQVGMLACLAIMLFFFVKFQHVIWDVGPLACLVVVACMFTPVLICVYQSNFFGTLEDLSMDFRTCGMNLVPRNTMFRKFLLSTQPFYVEEAYPFFHYHKHTLLEFLAAGLDHAINLMLW